MLNPQSGSTNSKNATAENRDREEFLLNAFLRELSALRVEFALFGNTEAEQKHSQTLRVQ